MKASEIYEALCRVLEALNRADSEGSHLPSEWASRASVFGDVARAVETMRPGAVSLWADCGEWPAFPIAKGVS